MLENLLFSGVGVNLIGSLGSLPNVKYAWLLQIIESLINAVVDVGVGIIVFTIILKLITLPLDIFSRASMKKNALKMEMMRDDLEKLQKQYANNKQLYQQKMMALYKKNGYSALMPCLPTIVSLVFFIIVIGAFSSYSRKADFEVFRQMQSAYDQAIVKEVDGEPVYNENYIVRVEDKDSTPDNPKYTYYVNVDNAVKKSSLVSYFDLTGIDYTAADAKADKNNYLLKVSYDSTNGYDNNFITELRKISGKEFNVYFVSEGEGKDTVYTGKLNFAHQKIQSELINFAVNDFVEKELSDPEIQDLLRKDENGKKALDKDDSGLYSIADINVFRARNSKIEVFINENTGEFDYLAYISNKYSDPADGEEAGSVKKLEIANKVFGGDLVDFIAESYATENIYKPARKAAKESYKKHRSSSVVFPWVKNLWVVDSPFKPAIPSYSELKSTLKISERQLSQKNYNELTADLNDYKQTGFGKGNGLFILVALSILTMLLSTVIMNKTQKTQMELSSVDGANGQAATQQKIMTWIMPIMFGIFAFIYSAGFSIYMVMSSILSTVFTLVINFCVEKAFKNKIIKKQAEETSKARYGKRR
ncbi:MAG: YidC/Oxa1 family membrane protein insertase [Candidatus Borkfalkiaceae bacterium]|nr:YidC/Oxa1 family membrane protein insertase [Christensenellaceae bacterium]